MLSLWRPGAQKGILESSKRDKKTLAQDQADILRCGRWKTWECRVGVWNIIFARGEASSFLF